MRNLKKFLALVLAMMMVFSLMITVNAADFADADDVSPAYAEAVEVLAGIGVIEGGSSDKLTPKDTFTRAHLATVAYRVGTGSVAGTTEVELYRAPGQFDDVGESHWANPYINFAHNAEWVHGVNDAQTLYNPGGDVTGYHALTILLQILGYGKQDEFIGREWQIEAARYGQEAGLTKGLLNTTLTKAATREEVFQMMFRALQADIVKYSADAKGYESTGETLGEKYFDLACVNTVDDWGRPVKAWYKDRNDNDELDANETVYASVKYPKVAEFTVAMSDCDIYDNDDFDVDEGTIIAYYLDGNQMPAAAASTSGDRYIDDLDVTDYIGGQGVLTEIYDIDGDYHIVSINTWLAKVTGVTAAYQDKNGHPVPRYIDLEIYTASDSSDTLALGGNLAVETIATAIPSEVYSRGDYVLVYINQPVYNTIPTDPNPLTSCEDIELVGSARTIGSGKVSSFSRAVGDTPAVTTMTSGDLDENVKNFLNLHEGTKNWVALGDLYGNLIGMASTAENYAILEAISWIHPGTVTGGYAAANLITASGDTLNNVPVIAIDGDGDGEAEDTVNNNDGQKNNGTVDNDGMIADNYMENTAYYGHLYTYVVDEDGNYTLYLHENAPSATGPEIVDVTGTGVITKESAEIKAGATVVAVPNDYTIFMVMQSDGSYKKYVGKDEVPSMTAADLCILNNAEGYAALVIVDGTPVGGGNTYMVAYVGEVPAAAASTRVISGNTHYGYWVYPIGETKAKLVYDSTANAATIWAGAVAHTGLYEFELLPNGRITSIVALADDSVTSHVTPATPANLAATTARYATIVASAAGQGTSIYGKQWNGSIFTDKVTTGDDIGYVTTREALTVIEVYKNSTAPNDDVVYMEPGSLSSIKAGDLLVIAYDVVAGTGINYANYIYVIKEMPTGGTQGSTQTGKLTLDVTAGVATATYTGAAGESGTVDVRIRYRAQGTDVWSWASAVEPLTIVAGSGVDTTTNPDLTLIITTTGVTTIYEVQACIVAANGTTVTATSAVEFYVS